MVKFTKRKLKDLGLQQEVYEALPTKVVGDAWEASFQTPQDKFTALTHVVPAGQQLKILFLRVWTQEAGGAKFSIVQTNPTEEGQTGTVEAYPVKGSTPSGARDYPMLESAGSEVLMGSLKAPVQVLEGSINFNVLRTPTPPTGARYGVVFWGVQKTPET